MSTGPWREAASAAMDRYACGDDAAFSELYDLLAPRLSSFLLRRTHDAALASDLLQQTFLQMHASRQHFAAGADVMSWAFAIARRLLGNQKGFRVPPGSFYLWLDVGDGAAFAKALWRKTGVRVMPGAFMGIEETPGDPKSNPGYPYVRVALVHDSLTIEAALGRVAEFLEGVD